MGVTAEPTAAGGCLSGVKLARLPAEDLDEESSVWVRGLGAGDCMAASTPPGWQALTVTPMPAVPYQGAPA